MVLRSYILPTSCEARITQKTQRRTPQTGNITVGSGVDALSRSIENGAADRELRNRRAVTYLPAVQQSGVIHGSDQQEQTQSREDRCASGGRSSRPEQYHVTREHGTERPFTSPLLQEKRGGTFNCVACGAPLFPSDTKFESGTGWPSFYAPVSKDAVQGNPRRFTWHATHGNPLRELRCASWACVSGRTAADRTALLHEWLRARLRCEGRRKRNGSVRYQT